MPSPTIVFPDPLAGGSERTGRLGPQKRNDPAGRLAALAVLLAAVIVVVQVIQRVTQPELAPVIDDPVNRLAALAAVLTAVGLYAAHRFEIVVPQILLMLGMLFDVVGAFSIAMIETSRSFDGSAPLLGISALAPWIVAVGAVTPNRPVVTLGVALAAATTWPLAYWLNSVRFGFVTESWRQISVWPALNYLVAILTYLMSRRTYRTACEAQTAQDLGSYRLIAPIGEGGMGEIWRAQHQMLARPAAIKLIKPAMTLSRDVSAQRFQREANMIASLQSPHTVYLYDFGTTQDGRLYYVMELLDGLSLQTLITNFGAQPASRVVAILRQVCQSLDEAHARMFVHRDLKPANVMLCKVAGRHDFVKVLDFGLAKFVGGIVDDTSPLTMEGVVPGTPEYMAPEVALGSSTIDGRVDLYALGCIAYVLLTGTLVFPDSGQLNVALKHVQVIPDRPSQRTRLPIPPALERLVLKCLEKKPADRPATAREVEQLLDACGAPPWSEDDAAAWWEQNVPPTSSLRSLAEASPFTASVQKAR